MEKKSMKGWLYLLPALIIITVFTLYPLIRAFSMSIMLDYDMIHNTFTGYGLENYQKVLSDKTFHKALTNTTIYAVVVVPCSIILSLLIAAMINGTKKTKGLFQTIYFLPYVTSVIAIGIVWSWIYNSRYGLLNSIIGFFGFEPIEWLNKPKYALPALIIFAVWKSMAFNIMVFLAGLQTIPKEIYDAAKVDSTPRWRVFLRITVPGIAPMIVYSYIMGIIGAFKVYNEVYSLYGGKAGPANSAITVVYYIWQKFYQSFKYGEAAAAAVILFFIILAFTMVQKLVRKLMSR